MQRPAKLTFEIQGTFEVAVQAQAVCVVSTTAVLPPVPSGDALMYSCDQSHRDRNDGRDIAGIRGYGASARNADLVGEL